MNAYSAVIKPARLALILFAVAVVFAFAAVIGMSHYRDHQEQALKQTEQQLVSTRENIKNLTYDLETIHRLTEQYQRLTRLGFVGEPNRDVWVQHLEAFYRDTRLPPTLSYALAPPQLFNPQAIPADAPTAYQNNVLRHDLVLELSAINDVEFLDFMDKLKADWNIPYRVETCQISRDIEPASGLQIRCTLQLYSMPGKAEVSR